MKVAGIMHCLKLGALAVVGLCVGCGALWDTSLPKELPLSLVKGETVMAAIDTGPPSWADSTWAVYGVESEGRYFSQSSESAEFEVDGEWNTYSLIARFAFGARGEVVQITNYAFNPELIGDVLYLDGRVHPTPDPGGFYAVESYGIEIADQVACSAYAKFFVGPLQAGTVEIAINGISNELGDEAAGFVVVEFDVPALANDEGFEKSRHFDAVAVRERPPMRLPDAPARLEPADGAVGFAMDVAFSALSWIDTARAESYEVHFGSTTPPPFLDEVTAGRYVLPPLASNTTYYWQIVAVNQLGRTPGPIQSFATTTDGLTIATVVPIPAGSFQMGDTLGDHLDWETSDETPVHAVYVDAFHIDAYEVTLAQYATALNWAYSQGDLIDVGTYGQVTKHGDDTITYVYVQWPYYKEEMHEIAWNGRAFNCSAAGANRPVVELPWYGAAAFCNWRSAMEGRSPSYDTSTWECHFAGDGYRLPTEAEWEKAARGGAVGQRFPWGDTIDHSHANYAACGACYSYDDSPYMDPTQHPNFTDYANSCVSPVGYFAPNGYGIYDMAGNVAEWCNDWYDAAYYERYPIDAWPANPTGPESGSERVLRGGSCQWFAYLSRVAWRGRVPMAPPAWEGDTRHGLRCARCVH